MDILNYMAILIFSMSLGMIIGNMIKEKDNYHGPNANKFTSTPYFYKKTGKCYKYRIELIPK